MLNDSIFAIAQVIAPCFKITGDLKRLDDTMQTIVAIAADAEKLHQTDGDVKRWLEMLKDVAYDVEDVLAEFSYEILRRRAHADNPLLKVPNFYWNGDTSNK
ncbi:putative disease resistance RPP13-like protein 1 [Papaver somniferum]|uniref:putative disease resistance RPP13-like protein 1 n=1 Tax=Papaver somniferum TaxID=3469 RepID=UPI000E6FEEDA|nr:putative disease resistance RPP13-like protein 1 [Papaver somniferum]